MADIGISIGLSGVQKYQQDLTQLQSGTQRFAGNTERSVGRLKSSFQELGNEVPILGRAIRVLSNPIAAATVGLIGLGSAVSSVVSTASGFETELSRVGALLRLDKNTQQFQALNAEAQRLGATTEFSAVQAGQAMQFLARAGFDANEVLAATEKTLSLATIGQIDLAQAADISSDILRQFGLQAGELGSVVDTLGFTSIRANTNISQLNEAFKFIGPTANALGVSIGETSAVIGVLSNAGLKGSLATRALGTSLLRLSKPTGEARDLIADLGINAFDSQGNFIGLANLVENLETSFSGLTQQQKQAALTTIFGAEAIQEFNILLDEGADGIRKFTAEIDEAAAGNGKFSKELQDKLLETYAGAVIVLKSAFEGLKIALGGPLLESLTGVVKVFATGIQDATQFALAIQSGEISLEPLAGVLGIATGALIAYNAATIQAALKGIPALVSSIGTQIVALRAQILNTNLSIGATAAYITVTNLLTGRIGLATAAMRLFNIVFASNPIALIGVAIATAAAAWLIFRDNTKKATVEQEKAARIGEQFSEIQKTITDGYTKEKAALDKLFKPLRDNNATQEQRKVAIAAINSQYGEYLPNLLTEKTSAEDLALAYKEVNRAIIENITTKAIQARAQSVLEKITQVEIDRATKLLELEREINAEVANGGVATGFTSREIEIQASAGLELDALYNELEAIDDAGAAIAEGLATSLEGIDLSSLFANKEPEIKVDADTTPAEASIQELKEETAINPIVVPVSLDVSNDLTTIEAPELEIRANLKLPSSVLDQINSLSALAKNAGVSVEFLERNFRDVNDAMGVFNNVGSRVIQTLGGSNEAAFMAGIEFERLSQQIGDVAVRSLTTFGETFGRELAIGIQDSVDFGATTERVFTGVASNLYAMATGSQTFGQAVANTFGIAKEEIFGLGSVASVVTNSLVKAFISAVDVLLSEVPKLVGVFLLKEAIVSAAVPPVAIPLAISGLALIGFSGFASELLKKVIGADELETPEFEAPEIGTGFSSGGASSTRLESGALTESSLNVFEQTQTSRTTEVNVIFDGQNVNAAFAQFFQVNEQLTG